MTSEILLDSPEAANQLDLECATRLVEACSHIERTELGLYDKLPGGTSLYAKYESEQPSGSFKARGAWVELNRLVESGHRHTVGASAGNHAVGMALAAKELGVDTTIFVPNTASQSRVDKIKAAGMDKQGKACARVAVADGGVDRALELARGSGLAVVEPFDDPDVISGQATVAQEALEQLDQAPDRVFLPCGGGGLTAGTLEALRACPNTRVTVVQLAGNDSAERSVEAEALQTASGVNSLTAGAAVSQIGQLPLEIMLANRQRLDFVTVTEVELGQVTWREANAWDASSSNVEACRYRSPEATALLSLAGAYKWASEHEQQNEIWLSLLSGSNVDQNAEDYLLETYLQNSQSLGAKACSAIRHS